MPFTRDDLVARAASTPEGEEVLITRAELADLRNSVSGAIELFGDGRYWTPEYGTEVFRLEGEVANVRFRVV